MEALLTSKVTKIIADNVKKTQRGGPRAVGAPFVDVAFFGRGKVLATLVRGEERGRCFVATLTVKGWKPLPSMTALSGKKVYSDAEAAEAVSALFAEVE